MENMPIKRLKNGIMMYEAIFEAQASQTPDFAIVEKIGGTTGRARRTSVSLDDARVSDAP